MTITEGMLVGNGQNTVALQRAIYDQTISIEVRSAQVNMCWRF